MLEKQRNGLGGKTRLCSCFQEAAAFSSHLQLSLAASLLPWPWVCLSIYTLVQPSSTRATQQPGRFEQHHERCQSCEPGLWPQQGDLGHPQECATRQDRRTQGIHTVEQGAKVQHLQVLCLPHESCQRSGPAFAQHLHPLQIQLQNKPKGVTLLSHSEAAFPSLLLKQHFHFVLLQIQGIHKGEKDTGDVAWGF